MPKQAPVAELTEHQIALLTDWTAHKDALDRVKETEMAKRLEIAKTLPFSADKEEGGQTIRLNAGWRLTLTKTMDYSMEKKNSTAVTEAMTRLATLNLEKAQLLISRWEPVMSVEVYKTLTDEEKQCIADVITIKPGAPQLALKPPAEKKV